MNIVDEFYQSGSDIDPEEKKYITDFLIQYHNLDKIGEPVRIIMTLSAKEMRRLSILYPGVFAPDRVALYDLYGYKKSELIYYFDSDLNLEYSRVKHYQ